MIVTFLLGHPDFEWRDFPTYLLHEHESRAAEFILDLQAVESFLDWKLSTPRWRFSIWSRSARYLLRGLAIERPDHVWRADITYIPVQRGFLYLVAIMDWAIRYVLAWRLPEAATGRLLVLSSFVLIRYAATSRPPRVGWRSWSTGRAR